jgi:DNA-binding transcriptional LysR family regulator
MTKDHTEPPDRLPLRSLYVFEAAARHRNMVRAAAELGMTQSAVSRHIRALEDQFHERLFQRGPRGLVLTEAGDVLSSYVGRGMAEIGAGFNRLWQPRQRATLEVTCSRTFALRILSPRIGSFIAASPWIDLRVNSHRYYSDPDRSDIDVSIRLGAGVWPNSVIIPLSAETLFPVCTPGLAAGSDEPLPFLQSAVLLHYTERAHWATWLRAAGLPESAAAMGPRFSEMAMALAAAEAGQGIAIARRSHVIDAIAEGRLVRPFAAFADDQEGYFLVMSHAAHQRSTVQAFAAWIKREMEELAAREAAPEA